MSKALQGLTQFAVVVDFTVERDDQVAIRAVHRLMA